MPQLINWDLLSHPYNWGVVILMLAIGAMFLMMLQAPLGQLSGLTVIAS